jgi:hypothetical protein
MLGKRYGSGYGTQEKREGVVGAEDKAGGVGY